MALKKLKLAVLISGRGSNMQALIEACRTPGFPAQINVVISSRPAAEGLKKARDAQIKTEILDHTIYRDREIFDKKLLQMLERYEIDLICLAGFMRILSPGFINHWPNKIINIHPSLLPAYKGMHTHERVLEDGQTESGCTVHYVTTELDGGPIIVQKRVAVHSNDTPEKLAARVLEQEHIAYPEAIRLIAEA